MEKGFYEGWPTYFVARRTSTHTLTPTGAQIWRFSARPLNSHQALNDVHQSAWGAEM